MASVRNVPPFPRNSPVIRDGYPTEAFNLWIDAVEDRIGGILGVLPDSLVSQAALADGAVSTDKVEIGAISSTEISTPGNVDITNTNTWTTLAEIDHTAFGGVVSLLFSCYLRTDNTGGASERLLWSRVVRDSTQVISDQALISVSAGSWFTLSYTQVYNDEPASGSTYTYKLQVLTTDDSTSGPFDGSSVCTPATWSNTSRADDITFRSLETKR